MTSQRLATLRFVAYFRTITIDDLACNQRLTRSGAAYRLRRAKQCGLVRSEVEEIANVRPGHGSAPLIWSLTRKGRQRLAYFEEHPEKVTHAIG